MSRISLFHWLTERFWPPKPASHDPKPWEDGIRWLEPNESPFGILVLDMRAFAGSVLSSTSHVRVADEFGRLRASTGEQHRRQRPRDGVAAACRLSYPYDGEHRNGPLFKAAQMEDKWDIYLYDDWLYFSRSWTGDLTYRAQLEWGEREVTVTAIDGPETSLADVDFLIKTHLHGWTVPLRFPGEFHSSCRQPEALRVLAFASFGHFGRWAAYGTFEDTTKIRPAAPTH